MNDLDKYFDSISNTIYNFEIDLNSRKYIFELENMPIANSSQTFNWLRFGKKRKMKLFIDNSEHPLTSEPMELRIKISKHLPEITKSIESKTHQMIKEIV